MRVRSVLLLLVAAGGCESLRPSPPTPPSSPPREAAKSTEPPLPPVEVLPVVASLPPAPTPVPPVEAEYDPLVSVANCLRRNDLLGAAAHLAFYVRTHPDQPMFRLQLAELYLRADRPAHARLHFEQFISEAQSGPATLRPHLVTAHIKSMEIAQRSGDRYTELFHRGVGLLLLVKEQDGVPEPDESLREEMLCKALRALLDAKDLKPGDSRVRVYLAEALERTGNRRAAATERTAARTPLTISELTPTERRVGLLEE